MIAGGYAAVPNWLVDDEETHAHDKLVYMVLARHVGRKGLAFPSVETIAKKAGISESSVKRASARLIERGLVQVIVPRRYKQGERTKGDATTNVYRISVHEPDDGIYEEDPRDIEEPSGHSDPRVEPSGQPDPRAQVTLTPGLGSQGPVEEASEEEASEEGGHPTSAARCPRHRDTLDPPPCGRCKEYRLNSEAASAQADVREKQADAREKTERARAHREQREDERRIKAEEILGCKVPCDRDGKINGMPCDHNPAKSEVYAGGMKRLLAVAVEKGIKLPPRLMAV